MSDPEGNKHQDSRENKTNWFSQGPDIKCFVIFQAFHFIVLQQQQRNTLKGQMNQKIEIFSFVALPSPNTKKSHPK